MPLSGTNAVTGQWIFKGRVTPCGHTNVCRAVEKVPRRPEWNRSWKSELWGSVWMRNFLFKWTNTSHQSSQPSLFLLLNSLKVLKQQTQTQKEEQHCPHWCHAAPWAPSSKISPSGFICPSPRVSKGTQNPGETCCAVDPSSAERTHLDFKH